jgi:prepilin-type N-terminal cleavage/methylation domain-containing protein/prepilin-type processing-associated H-X9-DG protein
MRPRSRFTFHVSRFTFHVSRPGFTLIELLVVLAIIGLLAGILFPVLAQAREKARQTQCASNLRQIGMAINMYVQDHDGQFPAVHAGVAGPGASKVMLGRWTDIIASYTNDQRIHQCPSFTDPSLYSYILNAWFAHATNSSAIPDWSGTIIVAERREGFDHFGYHPWDGTEAMRQAIGTERHNGGANYLFADGHVVPRRFAQTLEPVDQHNPNH